MSSASVNPGTIAWLLICFLGAAVSLKSVAVLARAGSPWTSAGWLLTLAYFVLAGLKVALAWSVPFHAEYVALALLTVAFILAGLNDERQAEPWWWPVRAGLRGRERPKA